MFPSTLTYSCLAVKKYSSLLEVVARCCLEVVEVVEEERIVLRRQEPSRGAASIVETVERSRSQRCGIFFLVSVATSSTIRSWPGPQLLYRCHQNQHLLHFDLIFYTIQDPS